MFRTVSMFGIAGMIGLVALVRLARAGRARIERKPIRVGWFETLVFGVTMLCGTALAVTGFWATLVLGRPMQGWLLMAHASIAGGFMAGLALLAALWAEDCRLCPAEPEAGVTGAAGSGDEEAGKFDTGWKIFFWLLLALGLVSSLSMLGSMLPLADTQGLDILYEVHRWCGLLLVMTAIGLGFRMPGRG